MIRKITADEVRHFLQTLDKQFVKAGFFIHSLRYNRTENGCLQNILLNYEERENNCNRTDECKTGEKDN